MPFFPLSYTDAYLLLLFLLFPHIFLEVIRTLVISHFCGDLLCPLSLYQTYTDYFLCYYCPNTTLIAVFKILGLEVIQRLCNVCEKVWTMYASSMSLFKGVKNGGLCYLQGILGANPWRYRWMSVHGLWCQHVPLKSKGFLLSLTRQAPARLHLHAALFPENCNHLSVTELQSLLISGKLTKLTVLHGRKVRALCRVQREAIGLSYCTSSS